ncbi:MAG: MFS transporter [Burkholderiaceae bacterium]
MAQVVFGLLAMTICLPSMQEWGQIFGRDQADVQLTLSAFLVTYGAMQLIYGPMSDRWGRRPLLMVGLSLSFVASVIAALSSDLNTLIAARALLGAGCAAGMVIGRAAVQDVFQGPARTKAMAYIGMALGVTPPVATLLGGQIHVHLGWSGNFVLLAGLAAVLMVMAWRWLNLPIQSKPSSRHWLLDMGGAYRRLLVEPAFHRFVFMLAATSCTF